MKTVPVSVMEADPRATLTECASSGSALIVELPGDRFVAVEPLEPGDDDSLVSELIESDPAFRALIARSKSATRSPFPVPRDG